MSRVPGLLPGFRFYPTDQELVVHYLKKKVAGENVQVLQTVIGDVDIYKFEPPELPGLATLQSGDLEWYFFHPLDSYMHGSRTSRCTRAGYWKLTGKHREVTVGSHIVGLKKTLVYYGGRAPNGQRTNWVMHEYSLHPEVQNKINVLNSYVLCRVYEKQGIGPRVGEKRGAPVMEDEVFSQGCVESHITSGFSKDESQSQNYVIKIEDLNSEENFQSFLESLTSLEDNPNKQIIAFDDSGIDTRASVSLENFHMEDLQENVYMEDLHSFLHPVPDEADMLCEMLEYGAETHIDQGLHLPSISDGPTCTGFLSNYSHLPLDHISVPSTQHNVARLTAGAYDTYNTTVMQSDCNLNQHCSAQLPHQLPTHVGVADYNGTSGFVQLCSNSSSSVSHREPLALEVRKH